MLPSSADCPVHMSLLLTCVATLFSNFYRMYCQVPLHCTGINAAETTELTDIESNFELCKFGSGLGSLLSSSCHLMQQAGNACLGVKLQVKTRVTAAEFECSSPGISLAAAWKRIAESKNSFDESGDCVCL